VGTTTAGGQATGTMEIGTGDLRVQTLAVGTASGGTHSAGTALGSLVTSGQVIGAGATTLVVGGGSDGASRGVQAQGSLQAAGVSGFANYQVGTLASLFGTTSTANGVLTLGSGGLSGAGSSSSLFVGAASGVSGAPQSGALASGSLHVTGGNISDVGFVAIGQAFTTTAAARGTVELDGGRLSTPHFLLIGRAVEGTAEGTLRVTNGEVVMAPTTPFGDPSVVHVGTAFQGGHGLGHLLAEQSSLSLGRMFVGANGGFPGSAEGHVDLVGSVLTATSLTGGTGFSARADITLVDSVMSITNEFLLAFGTLSLEDSLLGADFFELRDDTTTTIDINGLARGTQYGAIDARLAMLAGVLRITLVDLLASGPLLVFDLIRSASAGGISGDFSSVLFFDVPVGYTAWAGLELDGVDVYRLRLTAVPEPHVVLLLFGGVACAAIRRTVRSRRSVSR
jgi:hypothetical protein